MIILNPSDEWPRTVTLDPATGFRTPCDVPISDVVRRGIVEMKRAGKSPTRLIIGPNAKRMLEQYVESMGSLMVYDPRVNREEFMGLAIEWSAYDGMEIQ